MNTKINEKFKGHPIFSIGPMIFIIINIIGIVIILINNLEFNLKRAVFILILEIFFYFISGVSMYYFILKDGKIIIKNSWYFWIKKEICFKNIRSVLFKSRMKTGVSLYLEDKKGKIHAFSCDSIPSSELRKFYDLIKMMGIDVDSEIIL